MNAAQTILAQLGGNRFTAMTGAKNFAGSDNSLQFSIGRGAKNKANKVRVVLTPADTYDVEFYSVRGASFKELGKVEGVYADNLAAVFTEETGLDTHL